MILTARQVAAALLAVLALSGLACSNTTSIPGNDQGSEPINDDEALEYKKAIVRCYKTGGTRVVKVMGTLRCY